MGRQSWGASHGEPLQRLREIGISGWPQESCGALWGMKFFNAREKSEHEVRGGGGWGGEKSVQNKENPIQLSRFVLASSSLESLSARLTIK